MVVEAKNEDFMEFLEATSGALAPSATIDVDIPVPVVPDERIAMLIHYAQFMWTELVPDAGLSMKGVCIVGYSGQNQLGVNDALFGSIAMAASSSAMAAATSQLVEGDILYFKPAILIARRVLVMRTTMDASPVGNTECDVKIGYTLARVPIDRMLRALVE